MPIIEPVVITSALVIAPIMALLAGGSNLASAYIMGVLAITMVWTLHFWERTGRRYWWTGFIYTASYMAFFSPSSTEEGLICRISGVRGA